MQAKEVDTNLAKELAALQEAVEEVMRLQTAGGMKSSDANNSSLIEGREVSDIGDASGDAMLAVNALAGKLEQERETRTDELHKLSQCIADLSSGSDDIRFAVS